jgi:hypothetical protein
VQLGVSDQVEKKHHNGETTLHLKSKVLHIG